jgi:uncharacterized repeat protein (TIGR01451 family)
MTQPTPAHATKTSPSAHTAPNENTQSTSTRIGTSKSAHVVTTGTHIATRWAALAVAAATVVVSAQTPPVINESLAVRQVFPATNWWNLDIRSAPVDTSSQKYIDWISGRATNPSAVRKLHPDFGPPPYGVPYVVVSGDEPLTPVNFVAYGSESDAGAVGRPPGYPIPDEARTQTGYIEGNVAGGGTSGDRHMLLIDRDRWLLYETYATRWNTSTSRWDADSGAVFDLSTNARRTDGWTSADAAGLAIFPGLVRYDEIESPNEIRHAFRVTVRGTNGYVWPASHKAGSTAGAPPMGMRMRLKASKVLTGYPASIQKIFRAMQTYGLIVADNGSDMYITGTMDARWNNDQLNPAFASLTADDFEVIALGYGKPTSGPALSLAMTDAPDPITVGSDITYSIVVRNDGTAPATNVVVDDVLPTGAALVVALASQGSCAGNGPVHCTLGTLAAGGQATVTISARPSAAGTLNNRASVAANEAEADMTNNTAAVTTTVNAVAPPPPPPPAATTHIGNLDASATSTSRTTWKATVRMLAHDAQHRPLAGVTITGSWTGGYFGTSSCKTSSSGVCSISSGRISKMNSVRFDVTDLSRNGMLYDASQNHDPDGSSNGTQIFVSR